MFLRQHPHSANAATVSASAHETKFFHAVATTASDAAFAAARCTTVAASAEAHATGSHSATTTVVKHTAALQPASRTTAVDAIATAEKMTSHITTAAMARIASVEANPNTSAVGFITTFMSGLRSHATAESRPLPRPVLPALPPVLRAPRPSSNA